MNGEQLHEQPTLSKDEAFSFRSWFEDHFEHIHLAAYVAIMTCFAASVVRKFSVATAIIVVLGGLYLVHQGDLSKSPVFQVIARLTGWQIDENEQERETHVRADDLPEDGWRLDQSGLQAEDVNCDASKESGRVHRLGEAPEEWLSMRTNVESFERAEDDDNSADQLSKAQMEMLLRYMDNSKAQEQGPAAQRRQKLQRKLLLRNINASNGRAMATVKASEEKHDTDSKEAEDFEKLEALVKELENEESGRTKATSRTAKSSKKGQIEGSRSCKPQNKVHSKPKGQKSAPQEVLVPDEDRDDQSEEVSASVSEDIAELDEFQEVSKHRRSRQQNFEAEVNEAHLDVGSTQTGGTDASQSEGDLETNLEIAVFADADADNIRKSKNRKHKKKHKATLPKLQQIRPTVSLTPSKPPPLSTDKDTCSSKSQDTSNTHVHLNTCTLTTQMETHQLYNTAQQTPPAAKRSQPAPIIFGSLIPEDLLALKGGHISAKAVTSENASSMRLKAESSLDPSKMTAVEIADWFKSQGAEDKLRSFMLQVLGQQCQHG